MTLLKYRTKQIPFLRQLKYGDGDGARACTDNVRDCFLFASPLQMYTYNTHDQHMHTLFD